MGTQTINPLTKDQRRLMKEFQALMLEEFGQTWDMPGYVPEWSSQLQDAFTEAQRLVDAGFSPDIQSATQRLLSGDPGYQIDPTVREQYFQAQLAPAQYDFEQNTLRAIAEQYAGGSAGRSGDFQAALAEAGAQYGLGNTALLAGLVNEDEIRRWEAGQNALQRMPGAIELGQYQELMPLNTLMNAGLTQYGLDSEKMGEQFQQTIYGRDPLANPYIGQWLGAALNPYRVPAASGGGGFDPMQMFGQMMGGMLGGGGGAGGIIGSIVGLI